MLRFVLVFALAAGPVLAAVIQTGSQLIEMTQVSGSGSGSLKVETDSRELLQNPGFESGSIQPWVTTNWIVNNKYPHGGVYCASDVGNYTIRQWTDTVPGSEVQSVTFWARQPDQPAAQAIDFFYSDGSYEEFVLFPTPTWQQFDVTYRLNRGKSLVGFGLWGYSGGGPGPDSTYVDDVSILVPGSVHDMGVTALLCPVDTIPLDTPVVPLAVVRNYGAEPESVPVRMRIEDVCADAVWLDTVWVRVMPGQTVTVPFDTWQPVYPVLHRASAGVSCTGDTVASNDTLSHFFWVRGGSAVEEGGFAPPSRVPTVLTGAALRKALGRASLFDAVGRPADLERVEPGVYFVRRDESCRKVVVGR